LANTRSAEKRNRQAQKRRARNTRVRTALRSSVKKARDAVAQGDPATKDSVHAAMRALDKAASKGVIHKNAASRRISRMAKAARKAAQAPAEAK